MLPKLQNRKNSSRRRKPWLHKMNTHRTQQCAPSPTLSYKRFLISAGQGSHGWPLIPTVLGQTRLAYETGGGSQDKIAWLTTPCIKQPYLVYSSFRALLRACSTLQSLAAAHCHLEWIFSCSSRLSSPLISYCLLHIRQAYIPFLPSGTCLAASHSFKWSLLAIFVFPLGQVERLVLKTTALRPTAGASQGSAPAAPQMKEHLTRCREPRVAALSLLWWERGEGCAGWVRGAQQ